MSTIRITAAAACIATALAVQLSAAPAPRGDAIEALEKFLARPADAHAYRAWRRLEASGSGQRGWLEVDTSFAPASGLRYAVTAEGGSGYVRARVLRSLLDEEQRLIARGAAADIAISSANYLFASEGVGADGLARVELKPLRRERALVAGRIFLAPDDGGLVRVEGRLAKSPSFWISRVWVVRSYQRLNGIIVPVSLESIAQLRLFGTATLRMTYRYTEVDERPVADGSQG